MNRTHLYESFNEIDEMLLHRSETAKRHTGSGFLKWGAVAACLCLLFTSVFILFFTKNKQDSNAVQAIAALEYNGCFYEAIDIDWVLEKYGLPSEITADMAGAHRAYLESDGGIGYREVSAQTDIELYDYAPLPCAGVYVLRDGSRYMAALFCGFLSSDGNENRTLTELYGIYGIENAADIVSICKVDVHKYKPAGRIIDNKHSITEFYEVTAALESYSNDDFQRIKFDGIPEEKQQMAHNSFADDCRVLRIETANGLRFYISVYPSHGWIYGAGTLTYYRISPAMDAWLAENLF